MPLYDYEHPDGTVEEIPRSIADREIPGLKRLVTCKGGFAVMAVQPTLGHRVLKGLSEKEDRGGARDRLSGEFTPDQYKKAWADDLSKKVKT